MTITDNITLNNDITFTAKVYKSSNELENFISDNLDSCESMEDKKLFLDKIRIELSIQKYILAIGKKLAVEENDEDKKYNFYRQSIILGGLFSTLDRIENEL